MAPAKPGRPFVYDTDDARPVTVSLRVPRDLHDQLQRYVRQRLPMTVTEFLLDAARLKLDTPTDPRDLIMPDDNTVIQELQAMVETAVEAAFARREAQQRPPATAAPATASPSLSHDSNTVLQPSPSTIPMRKSGPPNPTGPGWTSYELAADGKTRLVTIGTNTYKLGVLCEYGHEHPHTGQSLRRLTDDQCVECSNTVLQPEDGAALNSARTHKGGRPRSAIGQQILGLLAQHPEGLTAEEIRVHTKAQKALGDTLQGMKRHGTVRTEGQGKALRYLVFQA